MLAKAWRKALSNAGFATETHPKLSAEELALWQAVLHPDAHEDGGLACNDKQLLTEMRESIMQWVKQVGRQILSGSFDLVNVTFPVSMFEPRSYLQKLADPFVYGGLLQSAATSADPLERMKLLVTWLVAGLHKGMAMWKKPFNPILGETWQATMDNGIRLFVEQASHHPPISCYVMEGPGGWRYTGWSRPAVVPVVKFYGIKTMAMGNRRLELADGTVIDIYTPSFAIKGVVYASRPRAEVLGSARLVDSTNRLEAVLHFGPVRGGRHQVLQRCDAVCGEIYKLPGGRPLDLRGGAMQRSATEAQPLCDAAASGSLLSRNRSCHSGTDGSSLGGGEVAEEEEEDAAEAEAIYAAVSSRLNDAPVDSDPAVHGGKRGCSGLGEGPHQPPRRSFTQESVGDVRRGRGSGAVSGGGGGLLGGGGVGVPGVAVARIEGSWLSHLNIDNKRYWTLSEAKPGQWRSVSNPLPSDSRFRDDLAALAAGDRAGSQRLKEEMEHKQRADRKLRETAGVFEH